PPAPRDEEPVDDEPLDDKPLDEQLIDDVAQEPTLPAEEAEATPAGDNHHPAAEAATDTPADPAVQEDEYGRPEPQANYVVHVYELKKFKRTIDRTFTPEEAEAFVTEYNRTSKLYNRWAVPAKNDVPPGKVLAQ